MAFACLACTCILIVHNAFHRGHTWMCISRVHGDNGVHEMNMQGFLNEQVMIVIESYDV